MAKKKTQKPEVKPYRAATPLLAKKPTPKQEVEKSLPPLTSTVELSVTAPTKQGSLFREQELDELAKVGLLRRSDAKEREELKRKSSEGSSFASRMALNKGVGSLDTAPHVVVTARAGTGKTFTLVVGIVYMFRERVAGLWEMLTSRMGFEPIPSPQQLAVWESMKLSAPFVRSVQFTAFNKAIVTDFEHKWKWVIDALAAAGIQFKFNTNHSMGVAAINNTLGRFPVEQNRVKAIVAKLEDKPLDYLWKTRAPLLKGVEELVSKCKSGLVGFGNEEVNWRDELEQIASHYDLDFEGWDNDIYALVPPVLEACKNPSEDRCINFDDMIWLPLVLNLPVPKADVILVDEAQDLDRSKQELVRRAGRRIILVGDPKQAIYGFAGADCRSMERMYESLSSSATVEVNESPYDRAYDRAFFGATSTTLPSKGCINLPLTVTRRCGKAIVKEANKLVADFEAHESNREGLIKEARYPVRDDGKEAPKPHYTETVLDGDMILCRVNAPLVSQCFRFLKAGRKANIQGRDVGQGLISTIKKAKATRVADLLKYVAHWLEVETEKENKKKIPSEARLIALADRAACIGAFCENQEYVEEVIRKVEAVFTDNRDSPGIRLSSIHKAKGLEAHNVYLLQPKGATIPHPMAKTPWQREQEYNLLYVAITRAIDTFTYVA